MASPPFRHHAFTGARPVDVWRRLQDPDIWARVAGADGTSRHTYEGGSLTGFEFAATVAGIRYRGTARVTEAIPEESMTLSIRSNEVLSLIVVDLIEEGAGTRLEVTIMLRPSGLLGPMVFPVISAAVERGFPESVERLAAGMDPVA